jgi:uncharacterized protein YjbI with pentapeptide repeats
VTTTQSPQSSLPIPCSSVRRAASASARRRLSNMASPLKVPPSPLGNRFEQSHAPPCGRIQSSGPSQQWRPNRQFANRHSGHPLHRAERRKPDRTQLWRQLNYSEANFSHQGLSGTNLKNAIFKNPYLRGANPDGANAKNASFLRCGLHRVRVSTQTLQGRRSS